MKSLPRSLGRPKEPAALLLVWIVFRGDFVRALPGESESAREFLYVRCSLQGSG